MLYLSIDIAGGRKLQKYEKGIAQHKSQQDQLCEVIHYQQHL